MKLIPLVLFCTKYLLVLCISSPLNLGSIYILNHLTNNKTVSDVKRTCKKCDKLQDCTERTVIDSPPHVFQLRIQTWFGENKSVFPAHINIRPYMEDKQGSAVVYQLYAVVLLSCAHYTSYCKSPSGMWNIYNDSRVRPVSLEEDVLKSDPYSLYYKRSPELDDGWVEREEVEPFEIVYVNNSSTTDEPQTSGVSDGFWELD